MSTPEATDPLPIENSTSPVHADMAPVHAALAAPAQPSQASLIVAVIWAVVAVILAAALLTGAQDQEYGGDAYTGLQNAVMLGVRGIAFLLFGSAALGVIIAMKRDRR